MMLMLLVRKYVPYLAADVLDRQALALRGVRVVAAHPQVHMGRQGAHPLHVLRAEPRLLGAGLADLAGLPAVQLEPATQAADRYLWINARGAAEELPRRVAEWGQAQG
jgi:hypothetical protein